MYRIPYPNGVGVGLILRMVSATRTQLPCGYLHTGQPIDPLVLPNEG